AFIFEARSEKSDGDRAKLFDVHGYDVAWHMIDGSEFGLAQAKVRSLMIGSRDGYLKDFVMPSLRVPRTAYLSDVIGDLIGG
ncbi:DNA cytosine methyltransferase, partial [Rhizobium ruizarguesonis]